MKSILKQNDINLLKSLKSTNLTVKDLGVILNKSETSIRNSIKTINTFFLENNLAPLKKIGTKYSLLSNSLQNLESFFIEETFELMPKDRLNYLTLELILTEKVNLNEKAKLFNVTRKTLSLDLEEVKKFLAKRNLYLKSIPWQGIFLEGSSSDKFFFGMKFIAKLISERDFNDFTTKTHKKFLNPLINKLYYEYIPISIENSLYEFNKNFFNKQKIDGGIYFFNCFLASLIYCYLKRNETLDVISNQISKELEDLKMSYSNLFISQNFQNEFYFLQNNNLILADLLIQMHPLYFKQLSQFDLIITKVIADFEKEFNFEFTESYKFRFIQIFNISKYKFKYKIKQFSCTSNFSKNDDELLNKIDKILQDNNLYFYKEDVNLILLLLKVNLINHQSNKQVYILILDCFYDSWLGNLIKIQLETKFFDFKIKVKPLYKINNYEILNENPDLILYTDFNFDNFFPNINIKKQQVKYTNVFSFINHFEKLGLF